MGQPAPLQEAPSSATVTRTTSLTVPRHLRVADAVSLGLGRVLDTATVLHDAEAIRPGRETVVLTAHVPQEVPVVEGPEGLAYAATASVPAATKRRRGGQATYRPDPVRRAAVPGTDVVAASSAVGPARTPVLVVAAPRAPVAARATAFRATAVEETAAAMIQKGARRPTPGAALTVLRAGVVPSADPEMDPATAGREARKTATVAQAAAPEPGEVHLAPRGAEMERLRPHLAKEAALGPAPVPDTDAVANVAVALAAAKVGISGSSTRFRAETPVPVAATPSCSLQAEERAAEEDAAWRCAAVAETDPGVAQGEPAETEVGAAVTEGLQATAAPRRMATGARVGAACRVPLAAPEVRPLLFLAASPIPAL